VYVTLLVMRTTRARTVPLTTVCGVDHRNDVWRLTHTLLPSCTVNAWNG